MTLSTDGNISPSVLINIYLLNHMHVANTPVFRNIYITVFIKSIHVHKNMIIKIVENVQNSVQRNGV